MHRVGADEAGKGPVLGPMVAAAVRAEPAAIPGDVDDSKQVDPGRREELAAALREREDVAFGISVVPVEDIDAPDTDMNGLTVRGQAEAIAAVARDGDGVLVDAGDVSAERFARRVREGAAEVGVAVDVRGEHGADEADPLVAAASVVAKVERDRRVATIAGGDREVGSGYPSDPTTRAFLEEYVASNGELPDCARRSWATSDDVLAAAEQAGLSEF